jgi:hypothetical protein
VSGGRLAVHGHFYQPDRRDPFSGRIPVEATAAPFPHWTARIADESYGPNVERGNFGRIGWDVGPALASWLRVERPEIHEGIVAADDGHNGLAQAYHHTILPLASARDRRTEIRWGVRDFERRFGRRSAGIWLPETAVDLLTLRICAEEGIRYTILAPWQAGVSAVETRRPYRVDVGSGLELAVLFFDGRLSAAVSFDPAATADADRFARERLLPALGEPLPDGSTPVTLIATDGEFYGHHQPFRELFLEQLTTRAMPDGVTTVGALLAAPADLALDPIAVRERTSWSCHHGVARWSAECADADDGRWKGPLRAALDRLAGAIDALTEAEGRSLGIDVWAARDGYADVTSGFEEAERYVAGLLEASGRRDPGSADRLGRLLAAQASRLAMFASDGWFWDDPARVETAQVLRFAAHAARTIDALCGSHTERELVADLGALRSAASGQDGAALYREALAAVDQPPPEP